MNVIINAMLYNEHLSQNLTLRLGTWNLFWKETKKKRIIVFGAGQASKTLVDKFLRGKKPVCFLDNDPKKRGTYIDGIPVKVPSDLTKKAYEKSVVLITSTVYMNDIARQLDEIGVDNYYAVLAMEAKCLRNKVIVGIINTVLYHLLPVQKSKIVFMNRPDNYFCNLKYVSKAFHQKYPEYKLVWITDNKKGYPDYVECVNNTKLRFLYHIATAKAWVFNDVQHHGIRKRKNQFFINTWHGCIPVKKIGLYSDLESIKNYHDVTETSAKTDLFISNSTWCSKMYRESFSYQGKILEAGTPRLDILYNRDEKTAARLRKKYKISTNSKVILYAPTFRGTGTKADIKIDAVVMDFEVLRKRLREIYQKDVYILLRLHPLIAEAGKNLKENEGIINVTDYLDIYELMLITDTLITDYSSLMFEASYVGQEVFLYAVDIEHYAKEERGFYFDYYKLPYPIATTEEELISNMSTIDYTEVQPKVDAFLSVLGLMENGNASEKVIDAINTMIHK